MKCYYQYLNNQRKSIHQIIISDSPLIVLDIDIYGDVMGVEYCN